MPTSDEDILLASLEAQGKKFLTLFSDLGHEKERIKDDKGLQTAPDFNGSTGSFDDELVEWTGFASESDLDMDPTEVSKIGLDGASIFAARTVS